MELRLEAGLSKRKTASKLRLSQTTITNLEDTDGAGTRITVLQLFHLANLLDVHPSVLLLGSEQKPGVLTPISEPSLQDDVHRLGALLTQERRRKRVATANLCLTLQWELGRLHATAIALADQLPHVGMRLEQVNGTLKIVPDAGKQFEGDQAADLKRLDAHRGLDRAAGQVAWLIYTGQYGNTYFGRVNAVERVYIASLLKRGIIERDGPQYRCTPAFLASFS